MTKHEIAMVLDGTKNTDGQVSIWLTKTSGAAPTYLSDFIGGHGKIYDGYSTHTEEFELVTHRLDDCISAALSNGVIVTFAPHRERIKNSEDHLVQTRELPLALGGYISYSYSGSDISQGYEITFISWQ